MVRVKFLDHSRCSAEPLIERSLGHAVARERTGLVADLPREDCRIVLIVTSCHSVLSCNDISYVIVIQFLSLLILHEAAYVVYIFVIAVYIRQKCLSISGPLKILSVSA